MEQLRDIGITFDGALRPRQSDCVQCSSITPSCPQCPSGQTCQITVPVDCTQCPRAFCTTSTPTTIPQASSGSGGPNVGAIAGGVIGGLVAIAIATYLVWRFCIKSKRQAAAQQDLWEEEDHARSEREKSFAQRRDQRASTHTVGSIASTVLTRASNIIQIAYIPGVTNRAAPQSPTVLVPPVPPIPIAHAGTPSSTQEDDHFFIPGDLRDSTYSGMSGYSDRTSYARTSYAPRSSIASTIYGKNAVVQAPALTGMRAKPTMVSMKMTGSGSSPLATPPVPNVDYEKYAPPRPISPAASTFSVGSTFLNSTSAHTAMPARAQVVRVMNGNGPKILGPKIVGPKKIDVSPKDTEASAEDQPSTPSTATRSESNPIIVINEPSSSPEQSPFSDPPKEKVEKRQSNASLSAVIEEATKRASQRDSRKPSSIPERGPSPFGDEHATHDD